MPSKGIIIGIIVAVTLLIIGIVVAVVMSKQKKTEVSEETPTTNNNGSDIPPGAVIQTPTESGVPSGRYIKISQNFVTCMNIAEIQVSSTIGGSNIAAGKSSTKSSGPDGDDKYPTGNLTDENLTNFTHTSCNDMPWMQVDLGSDVPIASISIINRTDCCQGRAIGSIVEIINAANTTVWKSNPLQGLNGEINPITPGIQVNMPGPKSWTLTPPNPDAVLG